MERDFQLKGGGLLRAGEQVKIALIDTENTHFLIDFMCAQLGLSRSGYYAWRKRKPSRQAVTGSRAAHEGAQAVRQSRGTYGCPRLHVALRREGFRLSRKRVARLMREEVLQARQRRSYRRTTNSNHAFPVPSNVLARRFDAPAPNTAWATDITYIDTREG